MTDMYQYSDYVARSMNWEAIDLHINTFLQYFEECNHVLEIGPGTGAFMRKLSEQGIRVTGLERNKSLVKALRLEGFEIVHGDAAHIGDSEQMNLSFDGAFCSHVIEHIEFSDLVALIDGLSRLVISDGVVVFAFPNPESIEMQLFHFWKDPEHVRLYHPRVVISLLEHFGFVIMDSFSQGPWGPFEQKIHRHTNTNSNLQSQVEANAYLRIRSIIRSPGRWLKNLLGISRLEVEADYFRRLRSIGREAVVVARKQDR